MTKEQAPRYWIGRDVVLTTIGRLQSRDWYESRDWAKYGTLQDVSSEGVVLLEREYISWRGPDYNPEEEKGGGSEHRPVYQFYPWHTVYSIREQEEEEKRDQELLEQKQKLTPRADYR
jgi:hypothetical protein